MSLNRSQRVDDSSSALGPGVSHPGEPGVGVDLAAPFVAPDAPTRWLFGLNRFGIRPGLGRIRGLLADLGHPEKHLRTLVVAGTNGKGSTTRILAHLLQSTGRKVVTFTSPHLLTVHERIRLNDNMFAASDFAQRVAAIRPLTEKHGASWFETLTALAVQFAHDNHADFFCCETGLGGRLDATNALPSEALLLTTVGLDHQRILGDTRTAIATEKLGLLKAGVPLFTGVDEDLRGQVFATAVAAGSPCFFLDELARWPAWPPGGASSWDLALRHQVHAGLPDFGTGVMRRNIALSLLALTELGATQAEALLPADPALALRNLFLPGRYQQVLANPCWVFDTAHNAQALSVALATFLQSPCAGRRVILLGSMLDKDLPRDIADTIAGCDHLVGVPVSLPRARTADDLRKMLKSWDLSPGVAASLWEQPVTVAASMVEALSAVATGIHQDDTVLVTGSCFMVAETLHRLGVTELDCTRKVSEAEPVLCHLRHLA